jgi:hypothetical protein
MKRNGEALEYMAIYAAYLVAVVDIVVERLSKIKGLGGVSPEVPISKYKVVPRFVRSGEPLRAQIIIGTVINVLKI